MKKQTGLSVIAMSLVLILASGCKKENPTFLSVLTTNEVSSITFKSAISGGSITSDGGSNIVARGVCWSSTTTPTIANNKTSDGGGIGSFTSSITGLSGGTTYFVRAYATNSDGTAYGSAYQFTTSAKPAFLFDTNVVSFITFNSAKSGGNITSDGGSNIVARGVCWSSTATPTIANNKTSDGGGIGSFTSSITGLSPETTYFVRAYATNSDSTAYGSAYQFTTSAKPALLLTTNEVRFFSYNAATSGGNITSDGGSAIVARGVCWSSTATPTVANNKTSDGRGIGSFTSSITGLSSETTYFVRAYATNSDGTAYGSVYQFKTLTKLPFLTTNVVSFITFNFAKSGGNITSEGGSTIVARGVCWSSTATPTIADNKTSDGGGVGSFTSSITGLSSETTYFVRAYATNSDGTAYGSVYQFKTLTKLPFLTTNVVSFITFNFAKSGGNITSEGGSTIVARGVCWSSTATPTIADNKTSDGERTGLFYSSITGLSPETTYFVRAYATNSDGTAYGSANQFKTLKAPAEITTALIPAGTFTMGSPESEVGRYYYETQHEVTLSAFRMSKYEITNEQYAAFLNAKSIGSNGRAGAYPSQTLIYESSSYGLHYSGSQWVPVAGYETSPVIDVTWYGAAEFAAYAGGSLPTEAQWEYACRAGTTTPFSTGTSLTNLQACYNRNGTKPVGSYAANAYGLYDMHGNVYEWCADWYGGEYSTSAQTNPTGPSTGSSRVFRGGSWSGKAENCRSAFRGNLSPGTSYSFIGFRVVFVP